jgi:hypothetical protein
MSPRCATALLVALALAFVACHRRDPMPTPERWTAPSASADTQPRAPETQPPAPVAPYPLGLSCDPKARPPLPEGAPDAAVTDCGRAGRVSVVTAPGSAVRLPDARGYKRKHGLDESTVYVEGSRVWIDEECMACRVPTRHVFIGDLTAMTDEQITRFQVSLGLPPTPLLTDADAWRKALG